MGALGIIFADGKFDQLGDLVKVRTEASIPFGGRYRIIDFTLSNFVNSDITDVGVITKRNYQSLMDHIGSGKEWDLSRKNGGIVIFPPFGNYRNDTIYQNTIQALYGLIGFIQKSKEDNIILTDCDSVNLINYTDVLSTHDKNDADITIVYRNVKKDEVKSDYLVLGLDKDNVSSAQFGIKNDVSAISISTYIIKKELLIDLLEVAINKGATSFDQEVIVNNIGKLNIKGYLYDGVYLGFDSIKSYYENNMSLLNEDVRKEVFYSMPLYTKVRDSAPTKYGSKSKVENIFIADGCIIEGTVKNSILFRGVRVEKDAVVENSILMQDTLVSQGVSLNAVITDKNVIISANQSLSGSKKLPYYIGKNVTI